MNERRKNIAKWKQLCNWIWKINLVQKEASPIQIFSFNPRGIKDLLVLVVLKLDSGEFFYELHGHFSCACQGYFGFARIVRNSSSVPSFHVISL